MLISDFSVYKSFNGTALAKPLSENIRTNINILHFLFK